MCFFFPSFVLLGLQCLLSFLMTIMSSMTNTASLVIGKGPVERNDSALQLLQPGVTITTRQHIIVENRERIPTRGIVAIPHVGWQLFLTWGALACTARTAEDPANVLRTSHSHIDAAVIVDETNVGVSQELLDGAVDDRHGCLGALAGIDRDDFGEVAHWRAEPLHHVLDGLLPGVSLYASVSKLI